MNEKTKIWADFSLSAPSLIFSINISYLSCLLQKQSTIYLILVNESNFATSNSHTVFIIVC